MWEGERVFVESKEKRLEKGKSFRFSRSYRHLDMNRWNRGRSSSLVLSPELWKDRKNRGWSLASLVEERSERLAPIRFVPLQDLKNTRVSFCGFFQQANNDGRERCSPSVPLACVSGNRILFGLRVGATFLTHIAQISVGPELAQSPIDAPLLFNFQASFWCGSNW